LAKTFLLDKIIKQGVTYKTKSNMGLIIRKIGTNSSGSGRLVVAGQKLGYIDSEVAPIHKTSSNLLGPLDLGDLYYVIPPNTEFEFEGDSGSKARLIGDQIFLEKGEGFPADFLGRYDNQRDKFITTYKDSFALGTDEAWKAGAEHEILSLTPLTTEKITINNVVMVSISGGTVSEGDFYVLFYMDDSPLEMTEFEEGARGIDVLSMPYPPADSTEEIVFTLKDYPIEVKGDHTLSIRVKNVSGADKSPSSGSAWSVKVKLLAVYERMG